MEEKTGPERYLAYFGRFSRLTRYLAYTSDVGEAVRPIVYPNVVKAAYGISFLYVGYDIGNHGYQSYKRDDSKSTTVKIVAERTLFQGLSSLLLPAITIHSVVHTAKSQLIKMKAKPGMIRWGPSVLGLSTLPLLPILFDEPVEHCLKQLFKNFQV